MTKRMFVRILIVMFFLFYGLASFSMAAEVCGEGTALTIAGPDAPTNGSQYSASGGVAPYSWCISKGSITQNGVVAVSGHCGTATITVWDSCGNQGTKKVRMPVGGWVRTSILKRDLDDFACYIGWPGFGYAFTYQMYDANCNKWPRISSTTGFQCETVSGSNKSVYSYLMVSDVNGSSCWGGSPTCGSINIAPLLCTAPNHPKCGTPIVFEKYDFEWRAPATCNDPERVCEPPCNLKITDFTFSAPTIEPGGSATFTGTITETSGKAVSWTITLPNGKTVNGSGKAPAAPWDGKDANGNPVLEGTYTATLAAKTDDGKCTDSKSVQITVKSSCDLKAELTGPGKELSFGTGDSYPITGSYTTSSSAPVNWTLSLPNGHTKSGSGSSIADTWDGTLGDGTLALAGTYQAVLTVTSSTNNACSATKELPIKVYTPPNSCGLMVDFGSSAHVANGNLSHSQELFSAKGGAQPLGLTLYYNSRDAHNASLGRGWSHNYDITLKENSDGSVLVTEPNWKYDYFTFSNDTYTPQPGYYSTLAKNPDGSFTLTRKDGTRYDFATGGAISAISDRNGNAVSFAYTGGNLTTVTDPAGRQAVFDYDTANHITSITNPMGTTHIFTYGNNTLLSVSSSASSLEPRAWFYTYDPNAFMLSKTDPLGATTTYAYDDKHRAISAIDPEGKTRSVTYPQGSDTTRTTAFTEKDGGVWQYSYDTKAGTLTAKTDPQGGVTSLTYDASGNRTSTTLPDGATTGYTYDNQGNMTSTTDALGQTTSYSYNDFGQVTGMTDPTGGATAYSYDDRGNFASITDAAGATTKYEFDGKGNVTKVTNAAGQATTFSYDAKGNLASVTDPAGATTSYTYDAAGNMTSQTDANGATTRFEYNSKNQPVQVTDPQGNVTAYGYDAAGNKTSQTDANGNITRYEYNYKGQLVKTTDVLGNATIYTYGGTGCASCGGGTDKLTSLADANGNATRYEYDQLGKLLKETDPLGNSTTYAYDAKGNMIAKTDGNGNTAKYSYDSLGKLLKKTYPDSSEETYTYDAKGNILTATNANISYGFSYDANSRVTKVTDSTGKAISYEYDALGNKTRMISPEGKSLTYQYDKANRLTAIINGGTFTFGYDTLGRRTSLFYPNGDVTSYSYDKQGRLTNLVHKNAAGSIFASNSYSLDKIGNRLSNTTQDRTTSYSYDTIYRLTQALTNTPGYSTNSKVTKGTINATQQQKEFYTYDPVGNRLSSDKTKAYVYNQGNQLVINGGTYSYDKNGNLIQKITPEGTTTYYWDYENRLVKVTTPTGTVDEFKYDPFGKRIEKKVTESSVTTTTRFFYDNEDILFEYDETGAIGNRYLYGPGIDEPLMLATGKDKYYYHADGLGSIVTMTDGSGKIVQTYEYDSFGNLKDQKNRIKQPYSYTGREWDKETGLYFYNARYYDPMGGRFISKDPIGFDGGDVNLFAYVQNNPVNYIDPYGLRADVYAIPLPSGGYSYMVTDDKGSYQAGTFNTNTINSNQLQPGNYTVSPRPHMEPSLADSIYNYFTGRGVNRREGYPTISNTGNWNTVVNPDGSVTHGAQFHEGRNGSNSGISNACMVTDKKNFDNVNTIFRNNYNDGGVFLHIMQPPR